MSFGKKLVEFLAGGTVEEKVEETKQKLSNDPIIRASQERIKQIDKERDDYIKHKKETDPEWAERFERTKKMIQNLGRWDLDDYHPIVLEFLTQKKGKKFTANDIYLKLTSNKWQSKYECLSMFDKDNAKEACTYLWQEDEIEKTGNHKYYVEE